MLIINCIAVLLFHMQKWAFNISIRKIEEICEKKESKKTKRKKAIVLLLLFFATLLKGYSCYFIFAIKLYRFA